jgi:hypothetical protein
VMPPWRRVLRSILKRPLSDHSKSCSSLAERAELISQPPRGLLRHGRIHPLAAPIHRVRCGYQRPSRSSREEVPCDICPLAHNRGFESAKHGGFTSKK